VLDRDLQDCRSTSLTKGSMHLTYGVDVEGVTRALGIPAEVSRIPLAPPAVYSLAYSTLPTACSIRILCLSK
jgi:hypothetical protein